MPAHGRHHSTALAAATADVVAAAQDMVAEQIAVARLEARADVARMLRAAAVGALGLLCAAVALVTIVLSASSLLEQWLPSSISLAIVGVLSLALAFTFVRRARAVLPASSSEPPLALPSHD